MYLDNVVRGGQSGGDVEELADADLTGQEAHRACQEPSLQPATAANSGNVVRMTSPASLSTG